MAGQLPLLFTKDELLTLLADILSGVASGDTQEGAIEFFLSDDKEKPFSVTGSYRIGNRDGQGSTIVVGPYLDADQSQEPQAGT